MQRNSSSRDARFDRVVSQVLRPVNGAVGNNQTINAAAPQVTGGQRTHRTGAEDKGRTSGQNIGTLSDVNTRVEPRMQRSNRLVDGHGDHRCARIINQCFAVDSLACV